MRSHHIRERFLHHIWCNQYIHADDLYTTSGHPVRVLDPGRLTLDAGPDVRGARLQVGDTLFTGDVEIHRTAPEWEIHGHHRDPRYNSVVLHVVLESPPIGHVSRTESGRELSVLILRHILADDLREVRIDATLDEQNSRDGHLLCSGLNDVVPRQLLDQWIDRLAVERFEVKLRRFDERLRELARLDKMTVREHASVWRNDETDPPSDDIPPPYSEPTLSDLKSRYIWEQLLYEGLMEGFGYSRNRRPFLRLAMGLTLGLLRGLSPDTLQTEAALLGVAGFLPSSDECGDIESRTYAHLLRAEWNAMRERIPCERLGRTDWVFVPTRPLNAPLVRLIAARDLVRKLLHGDLFRSVILSVRNIEEPIACRARLHTLLAAEPGPFWERRVSFSRVLPRRVQPLGQGRLDDLIVNCVFPITLLYARIFRDAALRQRTLEAIAAYPAAEPNVITRRMDRHLLRGRLDLSTSVRQQGVIQLFNYYCKEGRCRDCEVGRIVWGPGVSPQAGI